MAYATGSDAVIKIGSDTLTQCSAFSIDKTVDNAETSAIGTTSKTFVNTLDSWTGSLELFYDESDTATAAILTAAVGNSAAVSVSFYYEGTAAGVDKYLTGNGLISGISWNGEANGVFTASVSITGTGTLTEATAS
jgi:hypothetical protein|tara:strand:+ start:1972 stop:2379 length:408 start_codon:yes stop_codon:yes gene_type:complete